MSSKAKKIGINIQEAYIEQLFTTTFGTLCTCIGILSQHNPAVLYQYLESHQGELAGKSITEIKDILLSQYNLTIPDNSIALLYSDRYPVMFFPYVDGIPMPLYPNQYSAVLLAYHEGKATMEILH